jgi:hypothetical protein
MTQALQLSLTFTALHIVPLKKIKLQLHRGILPKKALKGKSCRLDLSLPSVIWTTYPLSYHFHLEQNSNTNLTRLLIFLKKKLTRLRHYTQT